MDNMNEERVRELESWAHGSREGLTTSECVLLDAISEVCREVRRLWETHEANGLELSRVEAGLLDLQDALERDRRAMEAAELERRLEGVGAQPGIGGEEDHAGEESAAPQPLEARGAAGPRHLESDEQQRGRDRKSTRLNSSHSQQSRMPSSA